MTDKEIEELHQKLIQACHSIGDHFETVQILASVTEEGDTYRIEHGIGNKFARIEQCRAFADHCQEIDKEASMSAYYDAMFEPTEEDEDGWKE
jgi:hypothetical protein